jgi:molecular chaperone HtpG
MLAKLAKDEPEKYQQFWREFGRAFKEGLAEDPASRERQLPLLRFASTAAVDNEEKVSLAEYVARMRPGQERIYYMVGESIEAARASPHLELLRQKEVEVLLMGDRVDEWVMGRIGEFEGKRFKDVSRGELELGGLSEAVDRARMDEEKREHKALLKRFKDALGDQVIEVRVSERLRDSPAVLVRGDTDMSAGMRRVLAANGQTMPAAAPAFELNVSHPLVRYLDTVKEAEPFGELAQLLYDQASLADEGQIANGPDFARRLNKLLVRLVEPRQ